jgi:hypothetical protein
MNRYAAPCQSDANHHRNRFEPSKLAAMRLLDRVADGQSVSDRDVQLALEVTGDVNRDAFADMPLREYARPRANRGFAAVEETL